VYIYVAQFQKISKLLSTMFCKKVCLHLMPEHENCLKMLRLSAGCVTKTGSKFQVDCRALQQQNTDYGITARSTSVYWQTA